MLQQVELSSLSVAMFIKFERKRHYLWALLIQDKYNYWKIVLPNNRREKYDIERFGNTKMRTISPNPFITYCEINGGGEYTD